MLSNDGMELICRLCMTGKGTFVPIFGANQSESTTPSLLEKISQCTEVQVREEYGLPESICHHCLYQIEIWFSFKQLCLRTNNFLHEEAQKTNIAMMTSSFSESQLIVDSCLSPSLNWDNERLSREGSKQIDNELVLSPTYNLSECGQFLTAPTRVYSRSRKDMCHICKEKFMNKDDLEYHMTDAHHNSSIEATSILQCSEDQTSPFLGDTEYDKSCSNTSAALHEETEDDFGNSAALCSTDKSCNNGPVVLLEDTQENFKSSSSLCPTEKVCSDTPVTLLEDSQEDFGSSTALCSVEKACNNTTVLLLGDTQGNFLSSASLCSADKVFNGTSVILLDDAQDDYDSSATLCSVDKTCHNTPTIQLEEPQEGLKSSDASANSDVVQTATIVLDASSFKAVTDKSNKETGSKILSQLSLKYRKANLYPCLFCGTFIQRISRHIETQHSNETDVKKLMSLKKKSVDRIRLLEQLRIQGIIKHNRRTKESRKKNIYNCIVGGVLQDPIAFSNAE